MQSSPLRVALAALLAAAPAAAQEPTPLDAAVEAAMTDEAARDAFYALYMDAELHLLVAAPLPEDGALSELDEVALLTTGYRGWPLVHAFDTRARLEAFAEARGVETYGAAMLSGAASLGLMRTDYYLMLNADGARKLFHPEEMALLRGE